MDKETMYLMFIGFLTEGLNEAHRSLIVLSKSGCPGKHHDSFRNYAANKAIEAKKIIDMYGGLKMTLDKQYEEGRGNDYNYIACPDCCGYGWAPHRDGDKIEKIICKTCGGEGIVSRLQETA